MLVEYNVWTRPADKCGESCHCVEVWYGSCESGACVEVADCDDGGVKVRASLTPERVVTFTRDEWRAFIAAVKRDEFDL